MVRISVRFTDFLSPTQLQGLTDHNASYILAVKPTEVSAKNLPSLLFFGLNTFRNAKDFLKGKVVCGSSVK